MTPFDWMTLAALVLIVAWGALSIYRASRPSDHDEEVYQALKGIGGAVATAGSRISRFLALVALLAVLVVTGVLLD